MNAKVIKESGLRVYTGYYGIGEASGKYEFIPSQHNGFLPVALMWRIDKVDGGVLLFYPDNGSHEFSYHSYASINSQGNFVITWKNITVPSGGTSLYYIMLA